MTELELDGGEGLDEHAVRRVVDGVVDALGAGEQDIALGVSFVDEARIRELNLTYRSRDAVTDVLSFPIDGLDDPLPLGVQRQLGDVVICLPQVARQAAAEGVPAGEELTAMLVHGVLHLAGYDHEADDGAMLRLQDDLLAALAPLRWEPE